MSKCLNCGEQNPPSKGNRKRKYCSKKCANKYYIKTERYYKRANDDWGTRGPKTKEERAKRMAVIRDLKESMYTIQRIEKEFGILRATAWYKANALDIKGRAHGGGATGCNHRFFTKEEALRIVTEDIGPEHDNEFLRKKRENARRRGRRRTAAQKKAALVRDVIRRKKKKAEDPAYRLRVNISALVYDALVRKQGRTKGGSTFAHLPYTPADLKEHIENQFDETMTWDNYGTHWNVDHIIPQAALVYDSLSHPNFRKCWALDNLRPLNRRENSRKGSFYKSKRHFYKK
jgi:hypothetical protein